MKSLHDRIRSAIEKIDRSDLTGGDVEKSIRLEQRLNEEVLSNTAYISNLDKISRPQILAYGSIEKDSAVGYRLIDLKSQEKILIKNMPSNLFKNQIVWSSVTSQIEFYCEKFQLSSDTESTLVVFPIFESEETNT